MERVTLLSNEALHDGWIDPQYIPAGKDKYHIRNQQARPPKGGWRHLRSDEIERLVKTGNSASSWDTVWVADEFDPSMVRDNKFYGTVRIGRIGNGALQYHDLRLPVGITNSSIHSCDIGDNCAIHDVHYLSHYIIGSHCMLFNIQEMDTTDHAKFGNGIVKDGEPEEVRVRIHIMNETGVRRVIPYDGMTTADAYLWGKYVDDTPLQRRLEEITQRTIDHQRGYYGEIGERCIIKNSSIIKDVRIGTDCYIKGASKLKNITINSSDKEPSQIGENVILVNGIVGFGCRIFYSCTAVKFILGNNSNLKYGARLIDSIMGDNSTISCCEVLNNLIFPAHEQHHNNSFLIASVIMGQSNMAAGATIGSNHNSRTNDGEIVAGRGFWPGLCSSVKHSSRFASFTLLAKGDYPAEMHIPLPFALVNNNVAADRLEIIPAYWWLYNMYALARNTWKYQSRDRRVTKIQNIEFDTFAPDTMQEALEARTMLEQWVGKVISREKHPSEGKALNADQYQAIGRQILHGDRTIVDGLTIQGENMERSRRPVHILKVYDAYHAYGDMLIHYAMSNVINYLDQAADEDLLERLDKATPTKRKPAQWINLGGQLMKASDIDRLRADICNGRLDSWKAIHHRYDELWRRYPTDKLRHSISCLMSVLGTDKLDRDYWLQALAHEERIQRRIAEQVYTSRKKDHDNPFRQLTCRNQEEASAIFGDIESNPFVYQMREETKRNIHRIERIREKL